MATKTDLQGGRGGGFVAQGKLGARNIQISGIEELDHLASKVAPKVARRLARGTVHKIAGIARNGMRRRAPQQSKTLRKAIVSKRRRGTATEVVSDVRITHGRGVKHDAWYWHFVEFGTVQQPAQPFIRPEIDEIVPRIPDLYREEFGKRLEKELAKQAKKRGGR